MKKKELYTKFVEALEQGKDIEVIVSVPGQNDPERIINTNKSINNKLLYYMSNYDEDLIHNKARDVKILGVNIIDDEEISIAHCENCGYEFPLNYKTPIQYREYGCPYTNCPNCHQKTGLDELVDCENVTPTNISFPRHFYKMDGVPIPDDRVEEWVKKAYDYLLHNSDEPFYYTATGNSICIGIQDEEEITIFVARDYYDFVTTKEQCDKTDNYPHDQYGENQQSQIYHLEGNGMSTSPVKKIKSTEEVDW